MATKTTTSTEKAHSSYNASNITSLEPRLHVRHRPGMYLGGISDEALTKAFTEIADNSRDEALAGHGDTIEMTFYADGSAEVEDHGRGLPVDTNAEGVSGVVLTVGRIGSGGKFDSSNYETSGGLNGVGSAASNFCSTRFDVTVYRDSKKHELSFHEGLPGHFAVPNNPEAKFTEGDKVKVSPDDRPAATKKQHPTGTKIRFWPDFSVFVEGSKFLVDNIKFQMKSTAFLMPGIKIIFNDNRIPGEEYTETYHYDAGIADMIETLTHSALLTKPMHLQAEGSFAQNTNIMGPDGKMIRGDVDRRVVIDMALAYVNDEDTVLKSFVNLIPTPNGGTHESGMWRAMSRVLINQIKNTRGLLTAKEEPPILDDVKDGFVGVLSVKFPEPTYTGQEKSTLATPQITAVASQAIGDALQMWVNDKKNAAQLKIILQKVVEASRIRLAAKNQKDLARKRSALESSSSLPSKLQECETPSSEFSELFIVEGDSALGTMRAARDARFQALLPIRGKILNVQKATTAAMIANAECANIIQVLGAGSGRNFELDQARYSKVIIAADADVDGNHIRSLLITFFLKYMRDYITDGRLYSLIAPLFVFTTQGKNTEKIYAIDEADRDRIAADLNKKKIKYEIGRNKGLGEMDADPAWDTLMNPQNRRLKQIKLTDLDAALGMVELAMGDKVPPRKEWITVNRDKIGAEVFED